MTYPRINSNLAFRIVLAADAGIEFKTYEEARDCLMPKLENIFDDSDITRQFIILNDKQKEGIKPSNCDQYNGVR